MSVFRTPKRTKLDEMQNDIGHITPSNRLFKVESPDSSPVSIIAASTSMSISPNDLKRGRPRAEVLNSLILHGSTSPSSIKCAYCNRVFPREKSLQAHLRTHTGERPFACDFPRCTRKFAQSGQLKTHQRLHTGEKPFICAAVNCNRKFTHANRHCPDHRDLALKRYNAPYEVNLENVENEDEDLKREIVQWVENLKSCEKNAAVSYTTPKKYRGTKRTFGNEIEQNENIENKSILQSAEISCHSPDKLSYGFTDYVFKCTNSDDIQENNVQLTLEDSYINNKTRITTKTELPKKRWLRAAVLEQQRWDSEGNHDLASPINWSDDTNLIENENSKRPTVLVKMGNNNEQHISSPDMQIAMALVELGSQGSQNYSY